MNGEAVSRGAAENGRRGGRIDKCSSSATCNSPRSPRLRVSQLAVVLAVATLAASTVADETPAGDVVVRVGTLHVGDGKTMKNALIVVAGGKFAVVGDGEPPPGSRVRSFPAGQATPGFIDCATRLAVQGGAAEDVEVLTPQVRAADAFDAKSRDLRGLVESGTTTIGVGPFGGNVAAGRAAVFRLGADAATPIETAGPPTFSFMYPALRHERVPATLAGARRLLESAFAGERWREAGEPDVPVRDASIAALRDLPAGPAFAWADTPVAAKTAVETLSAKKLAATLLGVRGCATEPDALASLGAPCVVTALAPEDPLAVLSLPARLHAKNVAVAISTAAPDRSPRSLRLALSLAVAAGLPTDAAVATVTSAPAKMLGQAARLGRVAPQLDADLVVFDGAPWDVRSRVLLVVAGGDVVFEAKR